MLLVRLYILFTRPAANFRRVGLGIASVWCGVARKDLLFAHELLLHDHEQRRHHSVFRALKKLLQSSLVLHCSWLTARGISSGQHCYETTLPERRTPRTFFFLFPAWKALALR